MHAKQPDLFCEQLDLLAGAKAPKLVDGWIGLGGGPDGRNWAWKHAALGIVVRHCGHPTALRPYYVPEDPHVKHSSLASAQAAALAFAINQERTPC